MDEEYKAIQLRYLYEIRTLLPEILAWWAASSTTAAEDLPPKGANDFERRWPAGPVAHPRILEVFRRHFLEIDDLNMRNRIERPLHEDASQSQMWGEDSDAEGIPFHKPIDVLINSIELFAPDVYVIVRGMVFVPIGVDPDGDFC